MSKKYQEGDAVIAIKKHHLLRVGSAYRVTIVFPANLNTRPRLRVKPISSDTWPDGAGVINGNTFDAEYFA